MRTRWKIRTACFAALLAAAGLAQAIDFTPATTLSTPERPAGAAIADFNRDGLADLAVTSDNPDKIAIFFGTGGGAFGPPVFIFTGAGTGPDTIVAADVNGDSHPDIVVALHNADIVRSYINDGAGNFVLGSNVATDQDPRGLIAFDLDGDGDLDFAVASRNQNSVTAIRNDAGVLVLGVTVPTGGQEPRGVAAGDFNRDGFVDLAVSNHNTRTVTILTASAPFTYALGATLPVPPSTRPDGILAADFDRDGDLDLAVAISDAPAVNVVGIFTNNSGVFAGPATFPTGGLDPSRLVAADFDLDGFVDVAVSNSDSANVSVLRNTTAGGPISLGAPIVLATGQRPQSLAAGDLDNNGSPDLAVPNRDSDTTSILLNGTAPDCPADFNGDNKVTSQDFFAFLNAFFAQLPSADFNRDGMINSQDFFDFLTAFFAGCP